MVIKNKTVLTGVETEKCLVDLARRGYLGRFIYIGFLALFGIVIFIIFMASGATTDSLVTGGLFLVVALLLTIMTITSIVKAPKRVYKNNRKIIDAGIVNDFTFKEESFAVVTKSGTYTTKFEAPYTDIKSIVDEEDRIIFNINKEELIICKKSGFASPKELELFFYGLAKHKTKVKHKKSS